MIEILDKHSVYFVSITQQFNTSTPMGRLMLNVLLSFAQFEREVRSGIRASSIPDSMSLLLLHELWEQVQQKLKSNAVKPFGPNHKTDTSLLIGKLFDASGQRLTPNHANKQGRRYRYYVSRHLAAGTEKVNAYSWRLPAQEMEDAVMQAVQQILDDQAILIDALRNAATDAKRIPAALDAAKAVSRKLKSREDGANIISLFLSW